MGYDTSYKYDLYAQHMEYALYHSEIIYTHSHGLTNGTGICLMNDIDLKSTNIDAEKMSGVELAYISACYAGGDFCETLYDTGNAQCVVGFTTPISASNDSNGIHYFHKRFFYHLYRGKSAAQAKNSALTDTYNQYQSYFGAENIEIHGYYS